MFFRHRNRVGTTRKGHRRRIDPRIAEALENRLLLSNSPSVENVSPVANATGIALNAPITVNVNLPNGGLNPNSVIGANVFLYPASNPYNNGDVPAVVNTTGGGDAIILTPSVNLLPSTKYTFSITAGVEDINGDAFTPFSESFTTGSMAPSIDPNIAFNKIALPTTDGTPFTDMQIGPDGELYASTEDGRIFRYVINPNGTLGKPQIITTLQTYEGGQRLITGFAFDPASTPSDPILWVSNTFYALSGATNAPNFTSKLTVMSGENLTNVTDAVVDLPRSISDHVNDQPIFEPGTDNLFFCQAGENAYGAPDTTWGNRAETLLSAAILEVNTSALNLNGPALNVLTPDVGGTYNPFANGAPLTIYATGVRNAFALYFDSQGQLWAVCNGSSSGGNTPAFTSGASGQINGNRIDTGQPYAGPNVPGLTDVAQTEVDTLDKIVQGGYYGHPDPARGEFVLDDGNPTTGGIPGLTFTAYPSGTNPDPNYRASDIFILGSHLSPDAIFPYTAPTGAADPFGGALDNQFLITEYSAGDDIAAIARTAGDNVATDSSDNVIADRSISGFKNFNNPLALLENPVNGYLYVSELGADKLTLLVPGSVAPQISATTSSVNNAVAFNAIASGYSGAGPSLTQTATITNTGADPLTFGSGAFSIVNAPGEPAAASNFTITNAGSLPSSLASGASFTIDLQYSATAVGLQYAMLQIQSNDPVHPAFDISLNGIGTPGQFGTDEPSLVQVLLAQNIPTVVGAGPDDANVNTQAYPIIPDPSSQEVPMQRLEEATPGPVTITPLASFSAATQPVSQIGYYAPGDPNATTELFYVNKADAQTVDPPAEGATSFDPGFGTSFGIYGQFVGTSTPNGSVDIHYSEDALNILDPTNERKIRFFPMETANGTAVPNTYIFAIEDYDDPTQYNSFINFVGIISNVQAAPDATAGSTPSNTTGNNPPVLGVQLNQSDPDATNLVFNTIQNTNTIVPDVVDNTNTITITNTGDQPLVINSLTLANTTTGSNAPASSIWQLVNPPVAGTAIAGGSSLTVTIEFVASTDPPHTTNETNDTVTTNKVSVTAAGGVWDGTLTIKTNALLNSSQVVNLAGYWQDETEHENEPGLFTIDNLMFGYDTSDEGSTSTSGTEYPNNGSTVVLYGDEVDPTTDQGLFVASQANEPVQLTEIASYHQQYDTVIATVGTNTESLKSASESGTTVTITAEGTDGFSTGQQVTIAGVAVAGYNGTFTITATPSPTTFTYTDSTSGLATSNTAPTQAQAGWYPSGGSTKFLYKDAPNNGQTVFPQLAPDAFTTVETSFTPSGAFGLNLDGEKSQDALNTTDITTYGRSGHSILVFPVVNSSGNVVPNTWIVGMDYQDGTYDNNDYQDLLMVLTNATPQGMPGTPSDLQATLGTSGVNLQWAPSYAAVSYNVLASVNGGAFTQINASPITTNSYTDSTSAIGSVAYQVVAVNSSSVKSLAATTTINLVGAKNGQAPTPPAAPTITNANGASASGGQVLLTWTASSGATAYNVLREGPGQSSFTVLSAGSGITTTSFADTTVTNGMTYQYEIQATNAAGSSPFSTPMSVTVSQTQTGPAAPTITSLDGSSGTQVVVNWSAVTGATSYNIERAGTDTAFAVIASDVTATSFTDTTVSPDTNYTYEVQATNNVGSSAYSAPMSVTVGPGVPAAPTDVLASVSGNSVVLTWMATTNAISYEVERESPGATSFSQIAGDVGTPTYTDTSVSAGDSYAYEIVAVDNAGASSPSASVTAAIPPPIAMLSETIGRGAKSFVKFTDATGATVTLRVAGPGTETVNFDATTLSPGASGAGVIITGTDVSIAGITTTGTTAGSSLVVTTKGGNNAVNIGGITVDSSLNSINAPTASLIGALNVTGSINSINLNSAVAAPITIGAKLGVFRAVNVTGATLTVSGTIGTIIATDWASNHAVTATSINAIVLRGNAQIDVTASVLHSLRVLGELHDSVLALSAPGVQDLGVLSTFSIDDSIINTAGNIGTIVASMLTDSQIYAGTGASGALAFPPVSGSFPAAATIANITLRKLAGTFSDSDSSIAASKIGLLNLGNVQLSNGGVPFGVQAVTINSLTAASASVKPFAFHRLTSDAIVSADFTAKNISPEDFSIEIV